MLKRYVIIKTMKTIAIIDDDVHIQTHASRQMVYGI